MKPLLIGEMNPYGSDPAFALWPEPSDASGGRLARILGMTNDEYIEAFDRVNLIEGDTWSSSLAQTFAGALSRERDPDQPFVLLGRKVAAAFELSRWMAFSIDTRRRTHLKRNLLVLPHPSGRNTIWNEEAACQRARDLVSTLRSAK